jgi:hypothetical protein
LSTTPTIFSLPLASRKDPCLVTTRELRSLLELLLAAYILGVSITDIRKKDSAQTVQTIIVIAIAAPENVLV